MPNRTLRMSPSKRLGIIFQVVHFKPQTSWYVIGFVEHNAKPAGDMLSARLLKFRRSKWQSVATISTPAITFVVIDVRDPVGLLNKFQGRPLRAICIFSGTTTHDGAIPSINGHFRDLNRRYLPYIYIYICKANVRTYPHKIWPYHLQFRYLKWPFMQWWIC